MFLGGKNLAKCISLAKLIEPAESTGGLISPPPSRKLLIRRPLLPDTLVAGVLNDFPAYGRVLEVEQVKDIVKAPTALDHGNNCIEKPARTLRCKVEVIMTKTGAYGS